MGDGARAQPDSDTTAPRPAPTSGGIDEAADATAVTGTDPGAGFACPRCGRPTTAEYYGPCDTCRTTLRMTITNDAKDVDDAVYEPKMNVTPNAVALKD